MKPPSKTNAARILDQKRIPYDLLGYEVDPEDLSAESVADKIGMPPGQVFKTLVVRTNVGEILMMCVPAGADLDLKQAARASGSKSVEMVAQKEVLPLTGYIRGGVSPIGAKKHYPVFLDESALLHERISISAGMRGAQLILSPRDLIIATNAKTAAIGGPQKE